MSDVSKDVELVKLAAERLGEHFDTVQILASRHEAGLEHGTANVSYGTGNWFARYGQAREWIVKCDERSRVFVQSGGSQ